MPHLSDHLVYYLTLTGFKWFIADQLVLCIYNNFTRTSSATSVLNNLNWPSLKQRRDVAKVTMFFNIINNLIAIPHDHLSPASISTHGHNLKFIQLAARTKTYLFSFSPRRSNCGTLYQMLLLILLV